MGHRAPRDILHGAVTLLATFAFQAFLGKPLAATPFRVNIFLPAVLVFAVIKGDLAGAGMGAAAGLVADAFSVGVFGIAGTVYTLVGFMAGWISRRIHILSFLRSFILFGLLGLIGMVFRLALTAAVIAEPIPWDRGRILLQPLSTAFLAAFAFAVFRRLRRSRVR